MGVMTSRGVGERGGGRMESKDGKGKQEGARERERDTRQHPVVTERRGGYGTDQPCVNGIPHREIVAGETFQGVIQTNVESFSLARHLISLVMCCVKTHSD